MTPVKGDDGHVLVDAGLDLSPIGEKSDEVHIERTVGRGRHRLNEATHRLRRKQTDRKLTGSSRIAHRNGKVWSRANEGHGGQRDRVAHTVFASKARHDTVIHAVLLRSRVPSGPSNTRAERPAKPVRPARCSESV